MTHDTDPVARALEALRHLNPTTHAEASALLDMWAHRAELTTEQAAEVLTHFPDHPEWCARPADEIEQGIHLGQVLDANPAPDSLLGVAVQLYQHHPMPEHPGPFPTGVALLVTEDSETQWYPLPQGQAVALLHRLRWALRRAGAVK